MNMRFKDISLIVSLVLFSILIVVIVINAFYLRGVAADMHTFLDSLTGDAPSAASVDIIRTMREYWESKRTAVSLSVSQNELDRVSEMIDALLVYAECFAESGDSNLTEYRKSMAHLRCAIDDICRLERFNPENLF